ncbi:uncharacterized protein [Miscanthus floridulus]|uniref:uncharacterized protein n=1 Tax=Miscanthus floridulus TaxID=154761 RepID=UPI003459023E
MDGGTILNILYANTLNRMGISRKDLYTGGAPFYVVISGAQATSLGSIWLLVTFGDLTNFRKEVLDFKVVDFASPYHALLGQPCYARFMAIRHYGCLKLKMSSPRGVIMVASSMAEAYRSELEGTTLAVADITAADFG